MRGRQPLALLAFLALEARAVSRTEASFLFFSDCPETTASGRFRRLLSATRSSLKAAGLAEVLLAEGSSLRLDERGLRCDVSRFGAFYKVGRPSQALALYRGTLLEGFSLKNAPEFERWLGLARETLLGQKLQLLEALSKEAAHRADWGAVIKHAGALLAEDPLREESHLMLMEAYHALGQRRDALRQFELLTETLRAELGVAPLAESQARYQALLQGQEAVTRTETVVPGSLNLPLVGRETQLEALQATVHKSQQGDFQLVLLTGASGIGKTRLLDELVVNLKRVLRMHCAEALANLPYGALLEALGEPPVFGDTEAVKARTWERLFELIVERFQAAPVLFIDDLQWADGASLEALPYLVHRLNALKMQELKAQGRAAPLVVLSYRNEGLHPAFESDLRKLTALTTLRLELPPLSQADTKRLVSANLEATEDLEARLFSESEGNPFYLVESLRFLQKQPRLDAAARLPDTVLPDTVQASIRARFDAVPRGAHQLAELMAVYARPLSFEDLQRYASLGESALMDALEGLERAGFVSAGPEGYGFSHGKLQDALYEGLTPTRRRLLHGRVAQLMPARAEAAALRLAHAERAHRWTDAADAARAAADAARRLGSLEAAAAFETRRLTALDKLGETDDAHRFNALLKRENDYHTLGERTKQGADLARLEGLALKLGRRADVLYRRGRYLNATSDWGAARSRLELALDVVKEGALAATVRLELAVAVAQQGDVAAALTLGEEVLQEAEAKGDVPLQLRTFLQLASFAQMQEEGSQTLHYLERAAPLAPLVPELNARYLVTRARSRLRGSDPGLMRQEAQQAFKAYKTLGDTEGQALSLALGGIAAGRLYSFSDAEKSYAAALELYRALGNQQQQAAVNINLAVLQNRLADYERAEGFAQAAFDLLKSLGDKRGQCAAALNLAAVKFHLGRAEAADWAKRALGLAQTLGLGLFEAVAYANLGGARFREGALKEAYKFYKQALELRPETDIGRALDLLYLGLVSLDLGDGQAANAYSLEAVGLLEAGSLVEHPQQVYAARAYILYCTGNPEDARAALARAQAQLEEVLQRIGDVKDRKRYSANHTFHAFISAAAQGYWNDLHPIFGEKRLTERQGVSAR